MVVLDAVMMSKMWEESTGMKAVREGTLLSNVSNSSTPTIPVPGMVGVEGVLTTAVRELLIWENLLLTARRKELQTNKHR